MTLERTAAALFRFGPRAASKHAGRVGGHPRRRLSLEFFVGRTVTMFKWIGITIAVLVLAYVAAAYLYRPVAAFHGHRRG